MISSADFYRLGFASQMIVWAARKRLHLLSRGDSEAKVVEAFSIAGFDQIHGALMRVLDVLMCGPSNRIQLHAVACPCLAPHEVSLLNALAYCQRGDESESEHYLTQLFRGPAAQFVRPAVETIVQELNERRLALTLIDPRQAPSRAGSATVH